MCDINEFGGHYADEISQTEQRNTNTLWYHLYVKS